MSELNGGKKMSKKIGIVILSIGILYLVLVAWLSSWWFVPDYRQLGRNFVTGETFYTSFAFFIIWSISTPLAAIMIVLGFGLYTKAEKNRILYFSIGSVLLLWWLASWYVLSVTSVLFGIGGGIIILSFLISIRSWSKKRGQLDDRNKLAADIRVLGHLFFFVAAWGICGLLGTPAFALRPELVIEYNTQIMAYTLGAKVMICLILGWICLAVSQFLEKRTLF
jgi:hypothetical protein